MNHEVPGINPDAKLRLENVQVELIVGAHYVDSASGFATIRKNIEKRGLSHFRRGFTNILFLEEGAGNLNLEAVDKINSDARRLNSWQRAFWAGHLGASDERTDFIVKTVDTNIVSVFERLRSAVGSDAIESMKFNYAVACAMDGIKRKGIDVTLAAEQPSHERIRSLDKMDDPTSDKVTKAKSSAEAARIGDVGIAGNIVDLARQNPFKTRILGVLGAAHARVKNYLPEELGEVEVSMYNDDENNPILRTIFDIQDGKLSDEEILRIWR